MNKINRRTLIKSIGITGAASYMVPGWAATKYDISAAKPKKSKFAYCFNTSTIRGQKLGIEKEIELVSKAGYDGIEVWIPVLNAYKAVSYTHLDVYKRQVFRLAAFD